MPALSTIAQPIRTFVTARLVFFVTAWFPLSAGQLDGGWSALSRTLSHANPFVGTNGTLQTRADAMADELLTIALTLGVNPQGLYLAIVFFVSFSPSSAPDLRGATSRCGRSAAAFRLCNPHLGDENCDSLKNQQEPSRKPRAAAETCRWKRIILRLQNTGT